MCMTLIKQRNKLYSPVILSVIRVESIFVMYATCSECQVVRELDAQWSQSAVISKECQRLTFYRRLFMYFGLI